MVSLLGLLIVQKMGLRSIRSSPDIQLITASSEMPMAAACDELLERGTEAWCMGAKARSVHELSVRYLQFVLLRHLAAFAMPLFRLLDAGQLAGHSWR
jgi:hypothetical protein